MARSAYREAAGYFEQALSALAHLPQARDTRAQAVDLRLALCWALRLLGDLARVLVSLREAEALATALDDPRRLAQVSIALSGHFRSTGADDQAITAAQQALALATADGDVVQQAQANHLLGLAYYAQGDYRRAIDCGMQTVVALGGERHHERFGPIFLLAVQSRALLSWCHAQLGTFAEGRACGEEGLRIAQEVDHPGGLMWACWGIALLALRQGDLSRALPLLERAMGLCQDAGFQLFLPLLAADLVAAYTLARRIADAVPLLTQAILREGRVGDWGRSQVALGEAQRLAGHLEEAHALAAHALALTRERRQRGLQAYALHLLGAIAAQRYESNMSTAIPAHEIYRTHMLEFKIRLGRAEYIARSESPVTGLSTLDAEFCFLQIRRIIELITFSAALRDEARYKKLRELQKAENKRDHGDYSKDWEAAEILKRLSEISPHFLPIPIKQITNIEPGILHIDRSSTVVTHGD